MLPFNKIAVAITARHYKVILKSKTRSIFLKKLVNNGTEKYHERAPLYVWGLPYRIIHFSALFSSLQYLLYNCTQVLHIFMYLRVYVFKKTHNSEKGKTIIL